MPCPTLQCLCHSLPRQVATLAQIFHLGHLPLEEKPPSAYRTDLAQETEKERPKVVGLHAIIERHVESLEAFLML